MERISRPAGSGPLRGTQPLPPPPPPAKPESRGFWGAVGGMLDGAGDVFRKVSDVAGDALDAALDGAGRVANEAIDAAGDLAGAALEAMGEKEAGQAVRQRADRIGDQVAHGLDLAGNVANRVVDSVGAVADTALDVAGAAIADGPVAAAGRLADEVLGPERPEYRGQIGGFTGVIANRLGAGDSVFVRLDAKGEAGVGAFAGGNVTGQAMLSRRPDGLLVLSLEAELTGEAGVQARFGVGVGGVEVGAKAKASAAATGAAKIDLTFDPNKPEDVERLRAIMEPLGDGAGAAANPLSAGSPRPGAIQAAIDHNFTSREVGGTLEVGAGVRANATVGGAGLEGNASARAAAGMTLRTNRDGSTVATSFFQAGVELRGRVGLDGSPLSAEGALGARYVRSMEESRDAQGQLTRLGGEFFVPVTARGGVGYQGRNARELADGGRGIKETKTSFGASSLEMTRVKIELNDKAMEVARRRIAAGESARDVFLDLADEPGNVTARRTTTTSDSFRLGFDVDLALGASLSLGASATVGRSHRESTDLQDADLLELGLITGAGHNQ